MQNRQQSISEKKRPQKGRSPRALLLGLCVLLMCACASEVTSQTPMKQPPPPWPTKAWSVARPEAVGMNSAALKEAEYIYPRLFPSGYSLLVIRNGYLVSESYFHGQTADTSNHVFSLTKTFVATLTAIAIKQGWIDNVQHRVADLLPEQTVHPKLAALKIEDVLTHRSGARNDRSFSDINLLLKAEPRSTPGTFFEYSNYAPSLLTAILDKEAKMVGATDVPTLAQRYLFGPLGIHISEWKKGPHGIPDGGNGLYMPARDLARLGYFMLRDGRWEDKQLLPTGWVQAATTPRSEFDRMKGYGYLIWVRSHPDMVKTAQGDQEVHSYYAYGHRGQFIGVYPALDLLVVTTADATDATRDTFFVQDLLNDFVQRFIFPAVMPSSVAPVKK